MSSRAQPPAGGERRLPDPADFLAGSSGNVTGRKLRAIATVADAVLDLRLRLGGAQRRVDEQARRIPNRRILALSVYDPGSFEIEQIASNLRHSRHELRLVLGSLGAAHPELKPWTVATGLTAGKFPNLNAIRAAAALDDEDYDWTIVLDDDVELVPDFLERFLGLCEGVGLQIAQPAQTRLSHAAWPIVRRRGGSLVRETRFVEIGPVTAFGRAAAAELLPFPDVQFGWGLDNHWSAVAAERGWRMGVTDAVPVRHERRPVAVNYAHGEAVAEARQLLAERPWTPAAQTAVTVRSHSRMPREAE